MSKRLKKVKIPTAAELLSAEAVKASMDAVKAAEQVVTLVRAPPSEWGVRYEAIKQGIRDRHAAQKAAQEPKRHPPVDPKTLTSDTIIEGDTIANWDAKMVAAMETAGGVVDLTGFPGWSCWAVNRWHAMGKPTPAKKVLEEITDLREEAEKLVKFAALDSEKAKSQNDKKAKKLIEAAEKKNKKAQEKFDKANKIAKEHKKK